MRTKYLSRLPGAVLVILLILAAGSPALGHEPGCSLATLDGLYVFSATGFVTPPGAAAIPKAIVELIRFSGDGTVTVPSVTLSVNGAITSASPGAPGTYTVAELVPPDDVCLGTLTFSSGNAFNLFIPLKGARIWMIQTNLNPNNSGNVFEGTARKIAR
jgi:hypothetical protein